MYCNFFFFNDTATTEIYTLSLHDALPICFRQHDRSHIAPGRAHRPEHPDLARPLPHARSEEHTSELQSQSNLVCRLLLEKKKYAKCLLKLKRLVSILPMTKSNK